MHNVYNLVETKRCRWNVFNPIAQAQGPDMHFAFANWDILDGAARGLPVKQIICRRFRFDNPFRMHNFQMS